jgi:acyl-CoA synthetase (AMP-forming)/AMP-acid ligase II
VRDLSGIYGWHEGDAVLSLVSPLHIYGLLHSFLLPWFSRTSVEFVNFQKGPVDITELASNRYAAVIAVPETWSFVKDLLNSRSLGTLVMSGAAFGTKRRSELLEAWIESDPLPVDAEVRRRYQAETPAPFPHRMHFLASFPRDRQGKVQILT